MFFFGNGRGLKRGRRREKRTPTCRPCLVWATDDPRTAGEAVVLDANAHGMLIRMLDAFLPGTRITIQMMLDDTFQTPLADAFRGRVVRSIEKDGFVDHGVHLERAAIKQPEVRRPVPVRKPASAPRKRTRMQTVDLRLGSRFK